MSFQAMAASLSATVSNNNVGQNQVFKLKVTFDDRVSSDAIDFSVLGKDFFVSTPRFNTSYQIINGAHSSKSEWILTLVAKGIGTTTIPAFELDGAQSQPITIKVSKDPSLPNQKELVSVVSQLDKKELYPNETATLKVRIIIKNAARQLKDTQLTEPKAEGLNLEKKGDDKQFQTVIDGVVANVIDQSYSITAEQPGKFEVTSFAFQSTVVYQSPQGATKLIPVNIEPETFMLKVNEKPADYTGYWLPTTHLELTQQWIDSNGDAIAKDNVKLTVGDSLTREVTLDIEGLEPEYFPAIEANYPTAIRVYAEKPSYTTLDNGLQRMTIRQVLIAQQQGSITLPDISVPWWNSLAQEQQIASINGLTVEVAPASISNPEIAPQVLQLASDVPQAEVEIVKDRGFWPYLAGGFALLWLITLIWALRRPKLVQSEPIVASTSSDDSSVIIQALKQQDWVKAQHLTNAWLIQQQGKDESIANEIAQELDKMNRAVYSSSPEKWDSTKLIKQIKKLNKLKSNKNNSTKLAKL